MKKGFTLIELLVVITIIAIIASIGLISYQKVSQSGRDSKRQADLKQVQSALEQYFADQFFYPAGYSTYGLLFGSAFDGTSGNPNPLVKVKLYLSKLPCDPLSNNCEMGGTQYCYKPSPDVCDNSSTNKCNSYKLYAILENPPIGSFTYTCAGRSDYNLEVTRP